MVIYENGTYQSDSAYPDTLYDSSARWVLPDYSPLADKYKGIVMGNGTPKLIFDGDNIVDVERDEEEGKKLQAELDIAALREELADGDYKIIKCYEASITGQDLPYDIVSLKAERDAIRAKINELQEML
jgi:hypothetical protein